MADVKFEIVRHIAVISDKGSGWTREINLVKWNDGGTKVDIRDWNGSRESMRKGITLNRQEFLVLVKSLKKIDAKELAEAYKSEPEVKEEQQPDAVSPEVAEFPGTLDLAVNG
ncbi:MAG: hypothetical protein J6112_02165 [Clostridia bacterium]|nr:hypothetical protein [Clostridia bacterium]